MVIFFSYFSQKTEFDISCKLSQLETVCMKYQILFSENKKNISICLLLKILPDILSGFICLGMVFCINIFQSGYIYGRLGNPTCDAVECVINELECGAGTLVFSSGTAAISAALFAFLKAGDHVVSRS